MLIIIMALPNLIGRFVSDPLLDTINTRFGQWSSIISMLGWGLSTVYLFQGEYANMKQNPSNISRWNFIVLTVYALILVGVNLMYGGQSTPEYIFWYRGFYNAQSRAFYGLMFLYLGSASYRMLRARSAESAVLMLAGLLYLARSASIFNLYLPWTIPLGEWFMNYPNKAAVTAASISMVFGQMLIAVRQMLGRERTAIEVA
jgi:hypothetical protein